MVLPNYPDVPPLPSKEIRHVLSIVLEDTYQWFYLVDNLCLSTIHDLLNFRQDDTTHGINGDGTDGSLGRIFENVIKEKQFNNIKAFQIWFLRIQKENGEVDVYQFDLPAMSDILSHPLNDMDSSFESETNLDEIIDKLIGDKKKE